MSHFNKNNIIKTIQCLNIHDIEKIIERIIIKDYEIFLVDIKRVFEQFKYYGDEFLNVEKGTCKKCKLGCTGFSFIGNKSNSFIDLIITENENGQIEISDCKELESPNRKIGDSEGAFEQLMLKEPEVDENCIF